MFVFSDAIGSRPRSLSEADDVVICNLLELKRLTIMLPRNIVFNASRMIFLFGDAALLGLEAVGHGLHSRLNHVGAVSSSTSALRTYSARARRHGAVHRGGVRPAAVARERNE